MIKKKINFIIAMELQQYNKQKKKKINMSKEKKGSNLEELILYCAVKKKTNKKKHWKSQCPSITEYIYI